MSVKQRYKISLDFSADQYNKILARAMESRGAKRSPAVFVRDLVIKALDVTPEDIIAKSLITVHKKQDKLDSRIRWLGEVFVYFVGIWFAYHPELGDTEKPKRAKEALLRQQAFLDMFKKSIFMKSGDLVESMLADFIETDVSKDAE